jgi:hypothetical protein
MLAQEREYIEVNILELSLKAEYVNNIIIEFENLIIILILLFALTEYHRAGCNNNRSIEILLLT